MNLLYLLVELNAFMQNLGFREGKENEFDERIALFLRHDQNMVFGWNLWRQFIIFSNFFASRMWIDFTFGVCLFFVFLSLLELGVFFFPSLPSVKALKLCYFLEELSAFLICAKIRIKWRRKKDFGGRDCVVKRIGIWKPVFDSFFLTCFSFFFFFK